jgi:hypothetical protein
MALYAVNLFSRLESGVGCHAHRFRTGFGGHLDGLPIAPDRRATSFRELAGATYRSSRCRVCDESGISDLFALGTPVCGWCPVAPKKTRPTVGPGLSGELNCADRGELLHVAVGLLTVQRTRGRKGPHVDAAVHILRQRRGMAVREADAKDARMVRGRTGRLPVR